MNLNDLIGQEQSLQPEEISSISPNVEQAKTETITNHPTGTNSMTEKFDFSELVDNMLRRSREQAYGLQWPLTGAILMETLCEGSLEEGEKQIPRAFLADVLEKRSKEDLTETLKDFLSARESDKPVLLPEYPQFGTEEIITLVREGESIALRTSGIKIIRLRHLFAATLTTPPAKSSTHGYLRELGLNPASMRLNYRDHLVAQENLQEDIAAWKLILEYDDLTIIEGISPGYQKDLRKIGVKTITQLAELNDVTTLQLSLKEESGNTYRENWIENWIGQAYELSKSMPPRDELFTNDQTGTKVYVSLSSWQWLLPVNTLMVPVRHNGSLGDFGEVLLERLSVENRKGLSQVILERTGNKISPETPALIPLETTYAARLLPNAPAGNEDQGCYLIAATAGRGKEDIDPREVADAVVKLASGAGVRRLAILPLESTNGNRVEWQDGEVGNRMIHGIWAALLDLETTSLTEVTLAAKEPEVVEAAKDKAHVLTRNRPQEVWSDQPAGEDLLGIKDQADALAETLLLRKVTPPLSVAILGGWGSGKSTVMRLMIKRMTQARIARIRKGWPDNQDSDEDEDDPTLSTRVGHIYQIRFNAWTYAKSNLWASLMQTVF